MAASVKQVKARFPEAAEAVGKKCESGEKGGQAEAGGESTGEEQESGALGKGEGGKQAAAKDKPAEKSIGGGFRKPLGKATRRAVGGQSAAGGKSSREGVKPGVLGKRQAGKEAAGKDQPAKRATRGAIGSARGQGKSGDDGDDDPEVMFLGSPKSAVVGGKGGKDTSALGDVNKETVDLPEAKGMAKIGKGDTGRAGGVKGGDLRLSLGGAGKEAAAEGERQGATTMGLANEVKTLSKENGALSAKVKSLDKEKATLAAKVKTLSEEKAALDGAMNAVKEVSSEHSVCWPV